MTTCFTKTLQVVQAKQNLYNATHALHNNFNIQLVSRILTISTSHNLQHGMQAIQRHGMNY